MIRINCDSVPVSEKFEAEALQLNNPTIPCYSSRLSSGAICINNRCAKLEPESCAKNEDCVAVHKGCVKWEAMNKEFFELEGHAVQRMLTCEHEQTKDPSPLVVCRQNKCHTTK